MRRNSVAGADLNPVVAEIVVVNSGERAVDAAVHWVVGTATVVAQRGEEVRGTERCRPAPEQNPLEVADGAEQFARIIGSYFAQFAGSDAVGFVPRDLHPLRIDAGSLLRIGPLHGLKHARGIVQSRQTGIALGTQLA